MNVMITDHTSSSSRMHVMNHNWSATKQCLHPQSVAEISRHSVLSGNLTMWDIVLVSPQGHRSVSVSRNFLLQALQCPCSVWKRFSRDHCCRGRSKPGCWIVGSQTILRGSHIHSVDAINKKLSCRTVTAQRFVSLNILLSHSRSSRLFEMTLLSRACVSPY